MIGGVYNSSDIKMDLYKLGVSGQHRGMESCGISVSNGGDFLILGGYGLVSNVFKEKIGDVDFKADRGTVHDRYSTTGSSCKNNVQPFKVGIYSLGHNGNLVNTEELREKYGKKYKLESTTDSEIIACILDDSESIVEGIERVYKECIGSYNLAILNNRGELAFFRDPWAVHPLFRGRKDNTIYVASEDNCIHALGVYDTKEFKPGELLVISDKGEESIIIGNEKQRRCFFEPIYFMSHGSTHKKEVVMNIRKKCGRKLAEKYPVDADIIVPVLDSGMQYAKGYHEETNIPMEHALTKNHYVGRTYMSPEGKDEETPKSLQMSRIEKVKLKNTPIPKIIKGKKIIVMEDSIVRSNTVRGIVEILYEAGAKEVHFRVASPPIDYPCFTGLDHAERRKLISAGCRNRSIEEIGKYVAEQTGAASVGYLGIEDMKEVLNDENDHCFACIDGKYHFDIPDTEFFRNALSL